MQEKYKKLSVLIPVYNEKQTINECVKNVLNAKIFNMSLEVVISDNNSIDGTIDFLRELDNRNIKNLRIIYNSKNLGKGGSIKKCSSIARGKYIACRLWSFRAIAFLLLPKTCRHIKFIFKNL